MVERMVWVVKDQDGNFVNENCFKRFDGDDLYISYRNFSEECRAYLSHERVIKALDKIRSKSVKEVIFKALEVNLSNVIRNNRLFHGENMIVKSIMH
ncbi:MAG TPA: hypothetical protein VIM42_11605 [Clostridium sp.]